MILVLTGTDHHPFDRLLRAVRDLQPSEPVRFQTPLAARYRLEYATQSRLHFAEYLDPAEMQACIRRAGVVITHGGPGVIFDCLAQGRTPIVVPRLARFGESVDDHQLAFARQLAAQRMIEIVEDVARLPARVGDYLARRARGEAPDFDLRAQRERRRIFQQRFALEVFELMADR